MIKRSLLAATIATIGAQSAVAAPFMPMDARGLAMGNTGVASAQRAHAPAYNPSLLSQAHESDDFALLFPQIGVNVADEEGLVDDANDIIDEIVPKFEDLFKDNSDFSNNVNALSTSATNLSNAITNLQNAISNNNASQILSSANQAKTSNQNLKQSLDGVNQQINDVNTVTEDLNKSLDAISGNPLRGRFGVGAALAFPGKKFAAALSVNADANFSGRALFSDQDQNLISAYGKEAQKLVGQASDASQNLDQVLQEIETNPLAPGLVSKVVPILNQVNNVANYTSDPVETAAGNILLFKNGQLSDEAKEPDLNSQVQIKAIAVAEAALSISREFEFFGEKVAIGLTPKLQQIETFHFVTEIDSDEDIDADAVEDSRESYNKVNLDIGLSYRFGGEDKWILGLVGKNLIGEEFDVADVEVKGSKNKLTLDGGTIALNPQYRAGLAYSGDWVTVAADLDLVDNEPVAFEKATQYAAVGAELDIFDTIQFRAGYRTNLKGSNDEVVSLGAGFSPFGVHLDLAVMANPNDPKKEAGVALETGFYF